MSNVEGNSREGNWALNRECKGGRDNGSWMNSGLVSKDVTEGYEFWGRRLDDNGDDDEREEEEGEEEEENVEEFRGEHRRNITVTNMSSKRMTPLDVDG